MAFERSFFLLTPLRDEKGNFLDGADSAPNLELLRDLDLFILKEDKEGDGW